MPFKKHKRVKIIKCAIVAYILLTAWFTFVNPWGCDRYQRNPLSQSKMKAKRIYDELERLKVNRQDSWPRAPRELDENSESRLKGVYASSAAYFDWLFKKGFSSMENGRGMQISFFVYADTDTAITSNNVMWSIAEGVDDETPDCAIVLVSANFDCSQLPSSYDGNEDLPMVTSDGMPAVFVMKNGMVYSLETKYLNARHIYYRQNFSCGPKSYLTPQGRVWTKR